MWMNLIKKMMDDKKEYKKQMMRVEALPEDYRFVFYKIHEYMWRLSKADGSEMLNKQQELITLFEESSSDGKHVLEVTGKDVAGFCDEFLRDTKKWMDLYSDKLNEAIRRNNRI